MSRRHAGGAAAAAAVSAAVTLFGLAVVVHGMTRLRWAHTYRQASGEGLGWVQVGMELVAGGVVALVGAGSLAWAGTRMDQEWRRTLTWAAWAVVAVVVLCALGAGAVEFIGRDRCIGNC